MGIGLGFCCCDNCTVFEDTFSREDSSDLGDDWTEVAGTDWEIEGGGLVGATAGDLVVAVAAYPTAFAVWHIDSIRVLIAGLDATGVHLRILVDYVDADNYHFADFRWYLHADTSVRIAMRLGVRSGGADDWIADESTELVSVSETYTDSISVDVCITDNTLTCQAVHTNSSTIIQSVQITPHAGRQVGFKAEDSHEIRLSTGGASAGVLLSRHDDEVEGCPACGATCALCTSEETINAPAVLKITFPEMSDLPPETGPPCEDCEPLSVATFEIPWAGASGGFCSWIGDIPHSCGEGGTAGVFIDLFDNGDGTVLVSVIVEGVGTWFDAAVAAFDCLNIDLLVPYDSDIDCTAAGPIRVFA